MAAEFLGLSGVAALIAFLLVVGLFTAIPIMMAHALYQVGGALRLLAEVQALRSGHGISDPWMKRATTTPIGPVVSWIVVLALAAVLALVLAFVTG